MPKTDAPQPADAPKYVDLDPVATLNETLAFAEYKEAYLWNRLRILATDKAKLEPAVRALVEQVNTLQAKVAEAEAANRALTEQVAIIGDGGTGGPAGVTSASPPLAD